MAAPPQNEWGRQQQVGHATLHRMATANDAEAMPPSMQVL